LSDVDKNTIPKKINESTKILNSIKKIIKSKKNAQIIYKDKDVKGIVPVALELYKDYEKKKFSGFSEALDEYFTKELKIAKKDDSANTKKIDEIKRIIEEQKETMKGMEKGEIENREKAELIYNNYQMIKGILDEMNKASEKYSWKEIKDKLKGHKVVKDVDVKEKRITIQID
jgi:predicted ribosome quality control (RQC) complex YloA/Tae2 family protein